MCACAYTTSLCVGGRTARRPERGKHTKTLDRSIDNTKKRVGRKITSKTKQQGVCVLQVSSSYFTCVPCFCFSLFYRARAECPSMRCRARGPDDALAPDCLGELDTLRNESTTVAPPHFGKRATTEALASSSDKRPASTSAFTSVTRARRSSGAIAGHRMDHSCFLSPKHLRKPTRWSAL